MKKMKIRIPATVITIDGDAWAEAYGLPQDDQQIRTDVEAYFVEALLYAARNHEAATID